ncbi:MAG TPA: aspartate/glutamate racemase family protein [Noviherbaspirillum sp.]|nr:aspartate/glutamate racemase family protein [Noviherbaspirillum sp.]
MKSPTIGILAGTAPGSTAAFIDLVVGECRSQYGAQHDSDFPRMLVCPQPAPPADGQAVMEQSILVGLRELEHAGADFLAIAGDPAHAFHPRLAESVGVRLLDIVELMLDAIPESGRRLALVAPRSTVESQIFHRALRRNGHRLIDLEWQEEVDDLIAATRIPDDEQLCAQRWTHLVARAERACIDTLLVASLDLSDVTQSAGTALHVVDAAQCLAHGVVAEWLARRVEE